MDESSVVRKLIDAVPGWSLGAIGTLLTFAITLKIVGIDFAGPINDITSAYADAIERQAAGMEKFDQAVGRMEELIGSQRRSIESILTTLGEQRKSIERIDMMLSHHEDRIAQLEYLSHEAER